MSIFSSKIFRGLITQNFSHSYAGYTAETKSSCKYLKPYNLLTDHVVSWYDVEHGYNKDLKFRLFKREKHTSLYTDTERSEETKSYRKGIGSKVCFKTKRRAITQKSSLISWAYYKLLLNYLSWSLEPGYICQ